MGVKVGEDLKVSEWLPVHRGTLLRQFSCDGRTLTTSPNGEPHRPAPVVQSPQVNGSNDNEDQDGLRLSLDGVNDVDNEAFYPGKLLRIWLRLPPKSPFFGEAGVGYEVKATFTGTHADDGPFADEVTDSGTISPGFGEVEFDGSIDTGNGTAAGTITISLDAGAEGTDPENPEDPGWGVVICTVTAEMTALPDTPDPVTTPTGDGVIEYTGNRNNPAYEPGLYNNGGADDDFTLLLEWTGGSTDWPGMLFRLFWKNLGPV